MANLKFIAVSRGLRGIVDYVTNREKTVEQLISGVNCVARTAVSEFEAVKKQFRKTEGRGYYHIVQAFAPDDPLDFATAHELGVKLAEHFKGYQCIVVTHMNTAHIHNHIIMNSVNFETGMKFHQSAREMQQVKDYCSQLCREYGLSVTESKADPFRIPTWKRRLTDHIKEAMEQSRTQQEFVAYMNAYGYDVKWEPHQKYITYTTPENIRCRDSKLFDQTLKRENIYSLNRNYAAYTIEQVAGNVGFDLWDEQTVKRLIVEQPGLMPYYPKDRALKRGIDLAYGKKQITASVTSSILQGKSIKHMADDLQKRITTMSRDSAIRTARTAVTGAQNAGRMDSYAAAEKMGIKLKKEWLATLDARTRHSHAMLDGEQVAQDKKFSNGCRFPGDPQGPPWEIYNCRCTLIAAVDGVDTSDGLRRTRDGLISDMTYAQWEASKQGYSGKQLSPYHMGSEKSAKDVTKKYIDSAKPRMGKVRYENGYRSKTHKE